ncbi:MAG: YbaB/EbfC family nucleoid-associated protein [Alphaproteobacteria bacterium]|nr:YbaB/EbfC family nucleoid-associated protein [Alphaproteobacteria bacterium]MBQ3117631.1 YbaB/EbfC family nucleoid-associated protein [Alphaproteobacteria bacterium]MBQ6854721.1 YbaB/EbfC family nucleoid-associated protein [Alphaproteobacteria bacterium]MBQ8558117.1 YbaB/EbfC family nucleoid-associated protein [Alphaproteobacteria bacterium]MBR3912668.1 YbaB/EbfC family nucleoid-associated protein [Alphaproteobacteria bacterium]
MKNIGELMKKAQMVQSQMNILQTKMEKQEFEGTAGNGAVKVVMTGKGLPISVSINPDVVDKNDVETLEDLVLLAIRDCRERTDDIIASEMERIQTSLGLPAGFKLPF